MQLRGEDNFSRRVSQGLQSKLPEFSIKSKQSILYKLAINPEGRLDPSDYTNPKRGDFAFETDILIRSDSIPLVVVESKISDPTTHDILTYSAKAAKHKEVYPWLRYGLLIRSDRGRIVRRFFIHNTSFDFAVAVKDDKEAVSELVEIIRKEAQIALQLQGALKGDRKVRKYAIDIELE